MLLLLVLFLLPIVFAANELDITGVRVYVDGTREIDADENGGDIDSNVYPGSEIELKFSLKNQFSRNEDIDIDDITITGIIEDIDIGADVEATLDSFSLGAAKTKETTLQFEIPQEVKAGTYDMIVTIEGEADDDDQTTYEEILDYKVKVIKKDHDVRFTEVEVSESTPACGDTVVLTAQLQNYGINRENARLEVHSDTLPVNFASVFALSEDIENPANKYTKNYNIALPATTSGYHELHLEVTYAGGRFDEQEKAVLQVSCDEKIEEPVQEETDVEATPVDVQEGNDQAGGIIVLPVDEGKNETSALPIVDEQETHSFVSQHKWTLLIISFNIIALLAGATVLYFMYRRKPNVPSQTTHSLGELDYNRLESSLDQKPKEPQKDKFSFY